MVSGDKYQQQPIETVAGRIVPAANIYSDNRFPGICVNFTLRSQQRCDDPQYQEILNHLRYWRPTCRVLAKLNASQRVLYENPVIRDRQIVEALTNHALATVITVSRAAAARVNSVAVNHLFNAAQSLGEIQMDNDFPPSSIYKNMRVVITKNVNKPKGVVNGQKAIIHLRSRNTVLLPLPNGCIVPIFPLAAPVTETDEEGQQHTDVHTAFPFVPGYAVTICKAQGQTFDNAVVWMDSDFVPRGTGYVALSRVRSLSSIHFLTPLKYQHFTPVHYDDGTV